MTNRKSKRLLSLLLSLVMVFSLTATPMLAADEEDTSSVTETSETQETSSASAVTLPEPEEVEEDAEAYASEDDTSEEVTSGQQEVLNGGISLASAEDDSNDSSSEENAEGSTVASVLPTADTDGVIKLSEDVALAEQYVLESGTVTIDLNGHSITNSTSNNLNFIIVVNSGATLTIKDSDPGENTIAGGVYAYGTLNIKSGTIAPSTNWGVEVSGGTVTVSGGTISAYYGIIVNSGSLEVKDEATITGTERAVEVGSGATATISGGTLSGGTYGVYVLGSGSATVSGGKISATNGIIVYSGSLEVKDGATITGTNRAVEVSTSSASATISGGTLSGIYAVMNFGGTLNISGGNISGTNTGIYHNSGTTTVTDGTIYGKYYGAKVYGGTLSASGGSFSCGERTNNFTYGIYVDSSNSAATVTLSGTVEVTANNTKGYGAAVVLFNTLNGNDNTSSVVTTLNVQDNAALTGSSYGISGNGSYSGDQVTKINISGGTVSGDWGIYHPQYGDLTITGGTITGTSTGIEMRAGNLTVTGGSIIAEGDPGSSTENGNGTTTVGAAIAVVQHTTKRDITVTITEAEGSTTTLSGYYGIFEADLEGNGETTENVKITVEAGTVTTTGDDEGSVAIYHDSSSYATVSVTGGTYSTDVTEYITAAETDSEDNSYIVAVINTTSSTSSTITQYTTLKAAYTAVTTGGTMILVDEVNNEQLGASSDKSVTLDLNGHIISRDSGSVIDCSNGTLTIKDSSQTDSEIGKGMVQGTGNVALKLRGGNVVLESGTLESTSTYAVTMSGGTLTVNGGAVIAATNANCIFYYTGGTLTINDGLFTVVERASTVIESDVTSGAIVNVGSNTASTASEDDEETNVQVSITGGVFQMYRPLLGSGIELEITGGYFLSKYSLSDYYPDGYGYTTVDSYTYLGTTYKNYYQVAQTNFTLVVTTTSEDSSTTVTSYHKTLVAAVNAAISAYSSDGSTDITITMNNDFETGKVPVEKAVTFTLNLNGHTLTSTDKGAFKVTASDATVIIKDDSEAETGTITTYDEDTASTSTTALFQVSKGTLTIISGHFNQNAEQDLVTGGGTVIITGGYFTSDPSNYVATDYTAYTPTDNEDYDYIVLTGVVASVADEDGSTTYYSALEKAVSAAMEGDIVTLLADATVDSVIKITKTVVLDLNGHTVKRGECTTSALIAVTTGGNLTVTDSSEGANGQIGDDLTFLVTSTDGSTSYSIGVGLEVAGGEVTISGGKLYGYYGLYAYAGKVTMTGGTMTGYIAAVVFGTAEIIASGGSIAAMDKEGTWNYGVYIAGGATATLSGADVTAVTEKGYGAGVVIFGNNETITDEGATYPTLYVSGGTITGSSYGISGNGSSDGTLIVITGGTITGSGGGIYHPQNGSMTITGEDGPVNISGVTGVQMCDGTLVIGQDSDEADYETNNARITIVGNGPDGSGNKSGDGLVNDGAAISIVNRLASAGYGTPTVTIYGGNFTGSDDSSAVNAYTWSNNTDSDWYDVDDYVNIYGGTYSSQVEYAYCGDGYAPSEADSEGKYTVENFYLGISTGTEEDISATISSVDSETGTMYVKVDGTKIGTEGYQTTAYPTTSRKYTITASTDDETETEETAATVDDSGDSKETTVQSTTISYIFAGWYSYDGDTGAYTALTEFPSDTTASYYAKFVDADVLTVKAQVSDEENSMRTLRLVSSVDTLSYKTVGFYVTINDGKENILSTNSVYQTISSAEVTYTPSNAFSTASNWFITKKITSIAESKYSSYTFKVSAFWTTLDGTTVKGAPSVPFTVQDILNANIKGTSTTSLGEY